MNVFASIGHHLPLYLFAILVIAQTWTRAKPQWIVQVWAELWCREIGGVLHETPKFAHTIRCSGTMLAPNLVLTAARCFTVPEDFLIAKSFGNCSTTPIAEYEIKSHSDFSNLTVIEPRHIRVYSGDGRTWRSHEGEPFLRESTYSWQASRIFINPEFLHYSRVFPYEADDDVAFNDLALLQVVIPVSDEKSSRRFPRISNSDDNNCYDDCRSTAWNYVLDRDPRNDAYKVKSLTGFMRLEQFKVIAELQDVRVRTSELCTRFLEKAKYYGQIGNEENIENAEMSYYYYRCFSSWVSKTSYRNTSNKYPLLDHGCYFDIGAPLICKNRRNILPARSRQLVSGISITNQCQWLYYKHRRIGIFQSLAPHHEWIMKIMGETKPSQSVFEQLYSFLGSGSRIPKPTWTIAFSINVTSILFLFYVGCH